MSEELLNGDTSVPLDELRAAIWGNVLTPKDGRKFDEAMAVWAKSPFCNSRPAIIVQARGTLDVATTVKFSRQHNLKLSIRGGGHGAGNPSCVAGGVMVDLSLMHSCHVDQASRTAVIDGGCLLGDVDRETSLYGLALPLGTVPVTGMGLVVNGGSGILSRIFGASCDNIVELQMVNAEGEVVTVNQQSDPDLFWAARGAGSCLGVVTSFKAKLHDVSGAYTGILVWRDDPHHDPFRAVARWMRDVGGKCRHLGFNVLRTVDPAQGPFITSMVVHVGPESIAEKEAFFKPLRDLGPVKDTVGQWTLCQTQFCLLPAVRALKAAAPVHYEYLTGGTFRMEEVTDEVIDSTIEVLAAKAPELGFSLCELSLLGGAVANSDAPFGYREGMAWVLQVGWVDPSHHQLGVGYAKQAKAALAPVSAKVEPYVNFQDFSAGEALTASEAAAKVGGAASLARLHAVKSRVDPHSVFCSTPFRRVLEA